MAGLDQQAMKKAAGEKAVDDYVKDGMTVGLGTGSTAYFAIKRVGELVAGGYDLRCVATSDASEKLARECGIPIVDLNDVDRIDVTIDGADEVDPQLNLIKGLGGALLREKIVAAATAEEIIIVDESKIVDRLGTRVPLPVEVVRFGHVRTAYGLKRQGCEPVLRMKDGEPFVTDGGNYIYDCRFPDGIGKAFFLQQALDTLPGVVECGLFLNMAAAAVISHGDGTITVKGRRKDRPEAGDSVRKTRCGRSPLHPAPPGTFGTFPMMPGAPFHRLLPARPNAVPVAYCLHYIFLN